MTSSCRRLRTSSYARRKEAWSSGAKVGVAISPRGARPVPSSPVSAGAQGIVVAGVGDGNFTTPALEALKRARAKGVNVVRASRVGSGIVRRNIEVNDDQLGSVASMALNPAKSRVLLKLALTKTKDPAAIQAYFDGG